MVRSLISNFAALFHGVNKRKLRKERRFAPLQETYNFLCDVINAQRRNFRRDEPKMAEILYCLRASLCKKPFHPLVISFVIIAKLRTILLLVNALSKRL